MLLTIAALFFAVLGISPSIAADSLQSAQTAVLNTLANKDILDLLGAGLTPEVVVAKIKASKCNFDTSPEMLKSLKAANVPDAVILAMVQAPVESNLSPSTIGRAETATIGCLNVKEIPLYQAPDVFTPVTKVVCGTKVSVLDRHDTWVKVGTGDGKAGWITHSLVSTEAEGVAADPAREKAVVNSAASSTSAPTNSLPPNILRAVAWRAIPWATTSYWQQAGSADTTCTGSGSWFGNTWNGNESCRTEYTPAQSVPVTWQHFTIYNLVETNSSWMVLGCTRNWAFSKCSYLVPGNHFEFQDRKGKISIKGHRAGKDKEQSLDLDIVSIQSKGS